MKRAMFWRVLAALMAFSMFAAACSSDSGSDGGSASEGSGEESSEGSDDSGSGSDDSGSSGGDDDQEVELAQGGGSVLDQIKERGQVNCGVSENSIAFSELQPDGSRTGFDADYCRVVAAAIFGDASKVEMIGLSAKDRFTAVQTGTVDLLMRNTTWTQSRDTDIGMDFGPTTYYDGQQLMGRAGDGFSSDSGIADIGGSVVCTNAGTTTEKNISEGAAALGVDIELKTFDNFDQVTEQFISGACDIVTTDGSGLVGRKAAQQPAGEEWVIFPGQPISKEPLGPTYGQNDSAFADVVNWAVYATIILDEHGVTSGNVDAQAASPDNPEIGRLLGGEGELQSGMGIPADGFMQVIKQVGNYDEIFARNLEPVGIKRAGSANARWDEGGLVFAPPAR